MQRRWWRRDRAMGFGDDFGFDGSDAFDWSAVESAVSDASDSSDGVAAARELRLFRVSHVPNGTRCLCGHLIHTGFWLRNCQTGRLVGPLGSTCVLNTGNGTVSSKAVTVARLLRIQDQALATPKQLAIRRDEGGLFHPRRYRRARRPGCIQTTTRGWDTSRFPRGA